MFSQFYFISGERAKIISLTQDVKVKEGKSSKLVCRVSGQPPPKVTWFKDGRSISRLNKDKIYEIKSYKWVFLETLTFMCDIFWH